MTKRKFPIVCVFFIFSLTLISCGPNSNNTQTGDNNKTDKKRDDTGDLSVGPDDSIDDIMKKAHGGRNNSLLAKVASGRANDKEKKQLVDLYVALSKLDPPRGTKESWQKLTGEVIAQAQAAAAGNGAGEKLNAAADCKGCHKLHK